MKVKVTRNDLKRYWNVVKVGYCDLYYLLSYERPFGYNSGVYGWNWDVYNLYGVVVTTGYRNLIGNQAVGVDEYETQAKCIIQNRNLSESERCEQITKLLHEFCIENGGY